MKASGALLKRVRQWDESALAEAYDQYAPAIYRYVYHRTGHQDTAQDIVAETFHRFLMALRNGGGPDKQLSAWLYRVAHNLIVDYYRRQPDQEPVTLEGDYVEVVGEEDDALRLLHLGTAQPLPLRERMAPPVAVKRTLLLTQAPAQIIRRHRPLLMRPPVIPEVAAVARGMAPVSVRVEMVVPDVRKKRDVSSYPFARLFLRPILSIVVYECKA